MGPVVVSGPPGFPASMVKVLPRRSMRMRTGALRSLLASCLDLEGRAGRGGPVLQGGQAIPVERHIGIGGARVEALADHEGSLAMGHGALADELDVGGKCHVARHLLPGELEGVGRAPDVVAAAGDAVLAFGGIELHLPLLRRDANVATGFELPEGLGEADRRQGTEGQGA